MYEIILFIRKLLNILINHMLQPLTVSQFYYLVLIPLSHHMCLYLMFITYLVLLRILFIWENL